MTELFIDANGARFLPAETDQPASAMLVRTVRGTQICVALTLCEGDPGNARRLAQQLSKRGYMPPDAPMSQQEWESRRASLDAFHAGIIWEVCGLGVPLGIALHRAGVPPGKHRNARRTITRAMKGIGWASDD